ncbi:copper resistance CopC family protein [Asanoa siamensis]|uniref:CopC domain-containing protein n=1 Tax=Asanoa siamensis TaxID=926357 RepID=A0ABQ4CMP3_9ACTN|nr:copper resistance CopC family protein [Asanoa siamensis]GIF72559.1 hypothetical protein Asi02nite_20770 [Asanoa siamensis]
MRRPAAALAALLVGLVVVVAPATPAAAHTKLAKAVPAAKSTVTEPVALVALTFSGLIRQKGTKVEVLGPDGVDYREGDAKALDKTITAPVTALPVGKIKVRWETVSSDGHTIKGEYLFANSAVPPPVATTPPATPAPSAAVTASPTPLAVVVPLPIEDNVNLVPAAIVLVVLLGLLFGFFWWWRRARASR